MQIPPCPIIKLVTRTLFMAECESVSVFDSFFPHTSERLQTRQAVHLFHKSSELIDFMLIKVAKYNPGKPIFFLDFEKGSEGAVMELLKPVCEFTGIGEDFEVFSAATQLPQFKEGMRIYLEEEGRMVYDEELEDSLTGYLSFVDPRTRLMGSRIISIEGCVESENIKDIGFYNMWRIMNGVAEGEKVRKSSPEHLNFQYFNGESGSPSEIFTFAAAVLRKDDKLDPTYKTNLTNMRVLDSKNQFVGTVFDQFHNFCLIKMHETPTSELHLENGEKINAWFPNYTA